MADIRLDGRQLPMENGSENAFVVEARNIITGCPSNNPCEGIHCNHPFECVDLWNLHECRFVCSIILIILKYFNSTDYFRLIY